MELRHLRYFLAVAEERSFVRAAKRLHISQPPLSRQIRELEDELGVQLLVRDNRSVTLTDAGSLLLDHVRALLLNLSETVKSVRGAGNGGSGVLTVQAAPSFCHRLSPLMETFARQYPTVALELQHDHNCSAIRDLLDKKVALAFTRELVSQPQLEFRAILKESLAAVLPVNHRLAKKRKLTAADLRQEPLIIFSHAGSPALHLATQNFLASWETTPKIVQEIREQDLESCFVAIQAGKGIAIATDAMEILGAGRNKLKTVAIDFAVPKLWIYQVWRTKDRSANLQSLLALSRALYAERKSA